MTLDDGPAARFVACDACPSNREEFCETCQGTGRLVEPIERPIVTPPLSVLYRLISWERGDKGMTGALDRALEAAQAAIEEYWTDSRRDAEENG